MSSENYRYGFNGKENDNEVKGKGNQQNFGDRMYDPMFQRWLSVDPLREVYPDATPYAFAMNTPLQAVDPDGRLVIFVNGFMKNQWLLADNRREVGWVPGYPTLGNKITNPNYRPYPTFELNIEDPTYLGEKFSYWKGMDKMFNARFNDDNSLYVNGSNLAGSQGSERYLAGIRSGFEVISEILSGKIILQKDETIKLIGHSQGAAHAAGIAYVLNESYKNGIIKNPVEMIYYLAPQEPTEFNSPQGIFAVQYSRKSDLIASVGIVSSEIVSGGSSFGKIPGITEFKVMISMEGLGNGLLGTRGGHDVETYIGIFDLKVGLKGSVRRNLKSIKDEISNKQ